MIVPPLSWFSICILIVSIILLNYEHVIEKHRKPFLWATAVAGLTILILENLAAWAGLWVFSLNQFSEVLIVLIPIEKYFLMLALFFATVFFTENLIESTRKNK